MKSRPSGRVWTGLVLLVLVARLVAGSLHEFFEVGLVPSTPALLTVVGFIVKGSTSTFILIALIALPVLVMLPELRLRPEVLAARPDESGAERRKRVAGVYRTRNWQTALMSVTLATVLALGGLTYATGQAQYRPEPQAVTSHAGMVHVSTEALQTNQLNLYTYAGKNVDVSFMMIKREEDDFAVALNVCGICPARGYHQEGNVLVCDNCNAPINLETVGMPGGCNPVPLAASLINGEIQIAVDDLDAAQNRFAAR